MKFYILVALVINVFPTCAMCETGAAYNTYLSELSYMCRLSNVSSPKEANQKIEKVITKMEAFKLLDTQKKGKVSNWDILAVFDDFIDSIAIYDKTHYKDSIFEYKKVKQKIIDLFELNTVGLDIKYGDLIS